MSRNQRQEHGMRHGSRAGAEASGRNAMKAGPPAYEGRRLPRPEDEVVDQGLGFDLTTLLNRRAALRALGLGAAVAGLAACSAGSGSTATSAGEGTASTGGSTATGSATASTTEIPDETAGPYPGDGSNGPDVLEQSGVVRSDIRPSFGSSTTTAEGIPLTLDLTVTDLARDGAAFAGVAVYAWHCDREGRYSMYSDGVTSENYLRGVQVADAQGKVRFTTIFPACYAGRWPHVHFEVYSTQADITESTAAIATSQLALPGDACDAVYATAGYEQSVTNKARLSLATDGIFGDDGGASQLAAVTGNVSSGYAASLTVPVDTRTAPAAGSGGGPGGAPPRR